ncbi:putative malate transporter YflS [compost metagenome]
MLMMVAGSAIMMTLTHYATGTSPIIFGSGYVTMGNWWRVGAVMCVFELLVFALVGTVWWKVLGYW